MQAPRKHLVEALALLVVVAALVGWLYRPTREAWSPLNHPGHLEQVSNAELEEGMVAHLEAFVSRHFKASGRLDAPRPSEAADLGILQQHWNDFIVEWERRRLPRDDLTRAIETSILQLSRSEGNQRQYGLDFARDARAALERRGHDGDRARP